MLFGSHDYLKAYNFLSSRRQHSMGSPQPILLSEISDYAEIYGFEGEIQFFCRVIAGMDSVYFDHEASKARAKAKKTPP